MENTGNKENIYSPALMIEKAVSSGADLDKLEKLLALQERWEANEARKAYHKAMADFKSVPIKILKDKKVGFDTSKGKVGYNHATLGNVVEQITLELSKCGLSASWKTHQNGKIIVTCKITHSMGYSEETSLQADADTTGSKNSIQALGSTITYLERYTLLAALGLATYEQDDDGSTEVELITAHQVSIILDQLVELGIDDKKLLEYLKIENLENMPLSLFSKAQAALEASRKKKKSNENS